MEKFRISVRSLVEFLLHSGDIDGGKGGMADKEAMQLGSRIHRKIQGSMGAGYRPEVSLKAEIVKETFTLFVEGRADGILEQDGRITVDEIKGVYRSLDAMEKPDLLHLAQAKCYAAIYGSEQKLDVISVQMTYCNLETEEIRRFVQEFSVKELKSWFDELTEQYCKWCEMQVKWKTCRQESIHACVFPFPYREGQKQLAAAVYRTIAHRKKLFIQAPTGVGKTISTVFPTVKAVGENLGEKIFYLTAKTVTRTVAEEAFSVLKGKGLRYKVLTLTAKEKICPLEEAKCNPIECPYAKGHYDRVNEAVFEMLNETEVFDREAIWKQSEKWKVCPYEMTLDLSMWVDAVICDYNYVFDPNARLKRFFGDNIKGEYLFLIDEAHNLVERGREMYSASLCKERFLEIRRLLKSKSRKISRTLEKCNRVLLEWKRECENYQIRKNISELILPLMNLCGELEDFLEEEPDGEVHEKLLEFYFEVSKFLNIYDLVDDHYVIYTYYAPDGSFLVRLYCVDTSANIQKCLDKANAAVFFSATLLPLRYYRMLLSDQEEDYTVYVPSPFPQERRLLLAATDVTSRYTRRNETEYRRVLRYIQTMASVKKGNYIVFFPSYQYMNRVREVCEGEYAYQNVELDDNEKMKNHSGKNGKSMEILVQDSHMTEEEREAFLQKFSPERTAERDTSLVAFCVMGGLFSEGIDLTGDRLIGVIVVGPGLPMVCTEQKILQGYFEEAGKDGFAYAYQYPGMNKVLQAAGRVIRTAADQGVILLLDDRFWRREYRELFPREWSDVKRVSLSSLEQELQAFWSRFPEVQ